MFSIKDPAEAITVTFDFSFLAASITSATVTASQYSGNADANPSAIVSGPTQISGAKALQKIVAGVAGTYYELTCQVTGADGNIYVLKEVLPIVSL